MLRPRLGLLLLLYIMLDFANPLMPGAVTFDPDDSVEAVRADRSRPGDGAAVLPPAPAAARPETTPPARPAARPAPAVAGRRRISPPPRLPARSPAPGPGPDDH